MMTLEKFEIGNFYLRRVTWIFLSIGLVNHFSCELEITEFACEFLPHQVEQWNMYLLWGLIGSLVIGEVIAWFWKRRVGGESITDTPDAT